MTEEIIAKLRSLDLSGGSYSRLSAIASCFYQPAFGWTRGACETLRDKLIEILEGKDVNDDNDHAHAHGCDYGHPRCDQHQVRYDELGNERHKAVCELRGVSIDALCEKYDYVDIYPEFIWAVGQAIALRHGASFEEIINRLIHLLGGDEPDLQMTPKAEESGVESAHKMTKSAENAKPESEDGGKVTITDELRKWIKSLYTPNSDELKLEGLRIADRIDAQFDRICEEQDRLQERLRAAELGCDANHRLAEANAKWADDLLDLLRDASREYKDRHYWKQVWHDRAEDMRMERDELREKCDRLKAKVEHQREQLAVYATMCDFDAIRALKRERNEHKHRADNAEGHVKSLERRLDAAHETYCALLNDAAREFRALTEERDELRRSLRQIAERAGVPHDLDLSEYGDKKIANAVIGQLGETKRYVKALEWVRDRRLPKIEAKRDELLDKLDDYDKTHVELPKDENGEYIHIGDVMDGYGKTIEVVELRYERSGWVLISKDGNEYANTFAFEHHREPTVEQVIRDLTLGKITEAQAIERIEGING